MSIFSVLKFIFNHPFNSKQKLRSVVQFFKWQIASRLIPYSFLYPFTEHAYLIIKRGLTGATGNLYCGLAEFEDMGFLLHLLRENDCFVDIGANIGAYTILAAAEVKSTVIAIEPIPSTFKLLEDNIMINRANNKVNAMNIGLSSKSGLLNFTRSFDTVNHVAENNTKDTISVEVKTLDSVVEQFAAPILLKIDVEGFETEVLKGASTTLMNQSLKAIIIELNGSGARYGFDESKIHSELLENGFKPYGYEPFTRNLYSLPSYGHNNTIYVRDYEFVKNRIQNARYIKVGPSKTQV